MSHERFTGAEPGPPDPLDGFGFTEDEQRLFRVSHDRFQAFLDDAATTIHRVDEAAIDAGEFLFVTLSRRAEARRDLVTFYGLGFHAARAQWVVEEWHWYRTHPGPETRKERVSREDARALLELRRTGIAPFVTEAPAPDRGERLARRADADAAYAELADMEDLTPAQEAPPLQYDLFTGELVAVPMPPPEQEAEEDMDDLGDAPPGESEKPLTRHEELLRMLPVMDDDEPMWWELEADYGVEIRMGYVDPEVILRGVQDEEAIDAFWDWYYSKEEDRQKMKQEIEDFKRFCEEFRATRDDPSP